MGDGARLQGEETAPYMSGRGGDEEDGGGEEEEERGKHIGAKELTVSVLFEVCELFCRFPCGEFRAVNIPSGSTMPSPAQSYPRAFTVPTGPGKRGSPNSTNNDDRHHEQRRMKSMSSDVRLVLLTRSSKRRASQK